VTNLSGITTVNIKALLAKEHVKRTIAAIRRIFREQRARKNG
jgi:hypothetical protein